MIPTLFWMLFQKSYICDKFDPHKARLNTCYGCFRFKGFKWSSRAQISTFGSQKPKMVLTNQEASPPSYYNNANIIVQ